MRNLETPMSFDPDKPYNDPLLPPKAELETKAVLRKAIAANKALAELKGAGNLIPNQGALINAIVLQGAKFCRRSWDRYREGRGRPGRTYVRETNMSQKHFQTCCGPFGGCGTLFWRDF